MHLVHILENLAGTTYMYGSYTLSLPPPLTSTIIILCTLSEIHKVICNLRQFTHWCSM